MRTKHLVCFCLPLILAACGGGHSSSSPAVVTGSGSGGSTGSTGTITTNPPAPPAQLDSIGQNGTIDGTNLPASAVLTATTATLDNVTGTGINPRDPAVTGTVDIVTDPTTHQVTSVTFHQDDGQDLFGLNGAVGANPQSSTKINAADIAGAIFAAQNVATGTNTTVAAEALSYSAFGGWVTQFRDGPDDGTTAVGVFAGGSLTPDASVPKTGSATYSGDAAGFASIPAAAGSPMGFSGNSAVGIDFGKQNVSTSFTNLQAVSTDGLTTAKLPDLTGTGSLVGAHYTTTLAGSGGLSGGAAGALFGPAAQETAGTFNAAGGGTTIIGSFGAKQTSLTK